MEKIYFKETGKEVQMGDILTVKFEIKTHLLGDITEIIHIRLTIFDLSKENEKNIDK